HVFPAAKRSVYPVWGRVRRDHVLEKLLQDAPKNPVRLSGIAKPATLICHATVVTRYNIRTVQELLGHKDVSTDNDLYAWLEQARPRCEESGGLTGTNNVQRSTLNVQR